MHRIVSFSQVLLMKMSIMDRVILMRGKLKEGEGIHFFNFIPKIETDVGFQR